MGDRELRASYQELVAELVVLLYRHDPIGIAFGDNPDEYAPEAGTVAVLLEDARTVDDVRAVVHAEFVRWFDEDTAGPVERYDSLAEEIRTLLGRQ